MCNKSILHRLLYKESVWWCMDIQIIIISAKGASENTVH
jgi:hypothetical protein